MAAGRWASCTSTIYCVPVSRNGDPQALAGRSELLCRLLYPALELPQRQLPEHQHPGRAVVETAPWGGQTRTLADTRSARNTHCIARTARLSPPVPDTCGHSRTALECYPAVTLAGATRCRASSPSAPSRPSSPVPLGKRFLTATCRACT